MAVADEIRQKLQETFTPRVLEVTDESEQHRGHAGFREGGESHFHVRIAADAFGAMSRIERHRAVHNALGAELVQKLHALALSIEA